MILIKERIGKMLEYLKEQIYPETLDIQNYKMVKTDRRFDPVEDLDTSSWEDFNREQIWGGHREYYWFETTVTIPEQFDQKCVVYELITGREGEWDATNPQFTIYVNGKLVQGLDVNHREIVLAEKAEAGAVYRITLSAFTGDQNFSLKLGQLLLHEHRIENQLKADFLLFRAGRFIGICEPAQLFFAGSFCHFHTPLLRMTRSFLPPLNGLPGPPPRRGIGGVFRAVKAAVCRWADRPDQMHRPWVYLWSGRGPHKRRGNPCTHRPAGCGSAPPQGC